MNGRDLTRPHDVLGNKRELLDRDTDLPLVSQLRERVSLKALRTAIRELRDYVRGVHILIQAHRIADVVVTGPGYAQIVFIVKPFARVNLRAQDRRKYHKIILALLKNLCHLRECELCVRQSELAAVLIQKLEPYTSSLVRACVQHLTRSEAISYRHLEWLLVPPPWYRDRVLLIGDAAHCNPPVLAQGASMGIEDAIVLAELLAKVASVDAALEQFTVRRNPRASLVVRNSVQLCEWEVKHLVGPQEIGRLMMETQKALSAPF